MNAPLSPFFFPSRFWYILNLIWWESWKDISQKMLQCFCWEDVAVLFFSIFRLDIFICICKNGYPSVAYVVIWFQTEIVFHSNCVFFGKEMAFSTPSASQQKTVLSMDFLLEKKNNLSFSWFYTSFVRLNLSQLWWCFVNLQA